ncbi:hypothetical protein LJB88_05370, partial [Erysipelotrichaceae bacterium OttesenSCG-928-M19]|nr:hypothetical protein [Erysipelotrichaceae bacterium OttesenSCG-928-M19]
LYKFDGKKLEKIRNKAAQINNMESINGVLFVSYGYNLFYINEETYRLEKIQQNKKEKIWTITSYKDMLNVIFNDNDKSELTVKSYQLPENTDKFKASKLEDLSFIETKAFKFSDKEYAKTISQNIKQETEKYVIFGDRMLCKRDFSSCKYTLIDGETVQTMVDDYIIYNSDRTYISRYPKGTKEAISEVIISDATMRSYDVMMFKIYSENGKEYQYFDYTLKNIY